MDKVSTFSPLGETWCFGPTSPELLGVPPTQHAARSTLGRLRIRRPAIHQLIEPQIPPGRLAGLLRCSLDAKGGVLVRDNVILVVGIDRLVLGRDVDFLRRQFDACKVLEQVGVVRRVHVDVGEGRVARLVGRG